MSRDIVADIVRNALAPEPAAVDGRPRETPLEERLRLLHNALGGTRQRVGEQQAKLEKLRAELDDYRALMEQVKERAVAAQRAADLLPPPPAPVPALPPSPAPEAPTPVLSAAAPAPLPSIPLEAAAGGSFAPAPRPLGDALSPRLSWRAFLPYAAIVAFGVGMSMLVTRRPAPASASLKLTAVPPPSPSLTVDAPPAPAAAAADKPAAGDDENNAEILALVTSYVPPGTKRTVADILGPEIDDPSTESPWTIMRVDERTTLVSFRPYGEVLDGAPVYEFTVDPVAKTVSAGADTVAALQGNPSTAAR